ncbi:phage holin family protein [Pseudomonas sp. Q1-7]|uniref:phage holin family protein n=1 Tax=Pseudomonas sp. Q1-7 TaxID=3020843 RepID=UPI0023014D7E|nr:phage holin family protein [Pseudomonas sp. Q1-7]
MGDPTSPKTPRAPSPRRVGASLLALLRSHVELFGIELQEQKANSLHLLLLGGLTLIFALLLLVGLSGLLLVLLWDTWRLEALGGLCLFYLLATLYCAIRLRAAVDDDGSPFGATLEELARDRERLLP